MKEKCYIISYNLADTNRAEGLENAIKSYGTWARITDNTWAIVASQTAVQVRDHLRGYIVLDVDRLFVVKSGIGAAWSNIRASSEWLKRNL